MDSFKNWIINEAQPPEPDYGDGTWSWGDIGRDWKNTPLARTLSNVGRKFTGQEQIPDPSDVNFAMNDRHIVKGLNKYDVALQSYGVHADHLPPAFKQGLHNIVFYALNGEPLNFMHLIPMLNAFNSSDQIAEDTKSMFSDPMNFIHVFDDVLTKNKDMWFRPDDNMKYPHRLDTVWLDDSFAAKADGYEKEVQSQLQSNKSQEPQEPDAEEVEGEEPSDIHPGVQATNEYFKQKGQGPCTSSFAEMLKILKKIMQSSSFQMPTTEDMINLQAYDNPYIPDEQKTYCKSTTENAIMKANEEIIDILQQIDGTCNNVLFDFAVQKVIKYAKEGYPLGLKDEKGNIVELTSKTKNNPKYWTELLFKGSAAC